MSTLQPLNVNKFLERLRERAEERGYDIEDGYCGPDGCDARLTESDIEAGECTQCHRPLCSFDEPEFDEDLEDDGLGDY